MHPLLTKLSENNSSLLIQQYFTKLTSITVGGNWAGFWGWVGGNWEGFWGGWKVTQATANQPEIITFGYRGKHLKKFQGIFSSKQTFFLHTHALLILCIEHVHCWRIFIWFSLFINRPIFLILEV